MTIRPMTAADLPQVERIYVDALPAVERKPVGWLRSLAPASEPSGYAAGAAYHAWVAEIAADVVGFAILFVPAAPSDAALLEYLAVTEHARGGGVGGRLFDHAIGTVGRPVLVEVERGDPDAERRRAFYRRHGCRDVMGLQYLLPLPGAPPMGLMVGGATSVSRAELARWLATVYADVYGQARGDPRLAAMIAPLGDPTDLT